LRWRNYRAFVGKTLGWSIIEIMQMPWDDFLLEVIEAHRLTDG